MPYLVGLGPGTKPPEQWADTLAGTYPLTRRAASRRGQAALQQARQQGHAGWRTHTQRIPWTAWAWLVAHRVTTRLTKKG